MDFFMKDLNTLSRDDKRKWWSQYKPCLHVKGATRNTLQQKTLTIGCLKRNI